MKILITGGTGSIGREIVNQLISDNEIICFDRNEEKTFYLQKEIIEKYPNAKLTICLGSITDKDRIEQVFETHKPDVVFHTAANKHVPLGEDNIHEFVYNNIQGTINLSEVALPYGCKFVFISTDKAVEPCSVMGYTKRMCEKYLLALQDNIVICRFGNIIGSSGSVYEIFDKQSKEGLITVTHPDMQRYFITPEKAVSNLIACSEFKSGVYIFDMGEPVKIMDVANKYGVEIKIIGLRQGEKITEKLYYDFESKEQTVNPNVFRILTLVSIGDKNAIVNICKESAAMNKEQIINKFKIINNE
jgi:FlaA1/EpsC-like NDP-sugar epimerase